MKNRNHSFWLPHSLPCSHSSFSGLPLTCHFLPVPLHMWFPLSGMFSQLALCPFQMLTSKWGLHLLLYQNRSAPVFPNLNSYIFSNKWFLTPPALSTTCSSPDFPFLGNGPSQVLKPKNSILSPLIWPYTWIQSNQSPRIYPKSIHLSCCPPPTPCSRPWPPCLTTVLVSCFCSCLSTIPHHTQQNTLKL